MNDVRTQTSTDNMVQERVNREDTSLSDDEVVRRVLGGDDALFEILLRRYNQRVYRVVRSILGSDPSAEDAMQEAYMRAYTKLDQYDGSGAFASWLTRIASNEALRIRKGRDRWIQQDMHTHDSGDQYAPPAHEQSERDVSLQLLLTQCIDRLPPAQRVVFVLRQVEDLSVAETADSLGISEANVKTRFHRANRSLRDSLERSLGAELQHVYGFAGVRCDRVVYAVLMRIRGEGDSAHNNGGCAR